ncbi:MAG: hypothetical protein GPOALKHO_000082 [Sodalis sp.]|nr:MAG: hypothetical protein GPOALKHO_000082 [Sodalis sp.]
MSNGKAVGIYFEHTFTPISWSVIDLTRVTRPTASILPSLNVDINVASIRQP